MKALNLKKELSTNLVELGYKELTPIQQESLPLILDGKDIIAQAKTGSGKTAAFGLGVLNAIDISCTRPQVLILCPTRELADQVAKEIRRLARMLANVKVLTICGGVSEFQQEKSLSHGSHIIVGTPGRVLRLIKKRILNLAKVTHFVLDEADRMLDMGFHEDITKIAGNIDTDRQTLLFSATYPDKIREMSEDLQRDAINIKVDSKHKQNLIEHIFFGVEEHREKEEALFKILSNYRPERLIVFCKTKVITDQVASYLKSKGVYAAAIHGDLEQRERTEVLTMFSNESLSVLVATDVAARGLDISELPAVVNFDLPKDLEVYVHRVGRTGRAGKSGQAYSLYLNKGSSQLSQIEKITGATIEKRQLSDLSSDERYDIEPPMSSMYIAAGKKSKLRAGDILGALIGEAGLEASDVGNISILATVSFVAIKNEKIETAVSSLRDGKIKNKKFRVGFV